MSSNAPRCGDVANSNDPVVKNVENVDENTEEKIILLKLKYRNWNQYRKFQLFERLI